MPSDYLSSARTVNERPEIAYQVDGLGHVGILRTDGSLQCSGTNSDGQCSVPTDLGPVRQVGIGRHHTCALLENGSIRCWGNNSAGQCHPPEGMCRARQMAVGFWHNLALLEDGTVVAWGKSSSGELAVPAIPRPIRKLVAGDGFSAALLDDGGVLVWGDTTSRSLAPPALLQPATDLHAGADHLLALLASGAVKCWGSNAQGQVAVPDDAEGSVAVHAGPRSSLARTAAGETLAWGTEVSWLPWEVSPQRMKSFLQRSEKCLKPALLLQLGTIEQPDIASTAVSGHHIVILRRDGTVDCRGLDTNGQCRVPNGLRRVARVAAGDRWSAALTEQGEVHVWGSGCTSLPWPVSGEHARRLLERDGNRLDRALVLRLLGQMRSVTQFVSARVSSAGICAVVALFDDGVVQGWIEGTDDARNVPDNLPLISEIAAGEDWIAVRAHDGEVFVWGIHCPALPWPVRGDGARRLIERSGTMLGISALRSAAGEIRGIAMTAEGRAHVAALSEDGRVSCWGDNKDGQCDVPGDLHAAAEIAAALDWSAALEAQGGKWFWGSVEEAMPWPNARLLPGSAIHIRGASLQLQRDGSLKIEGEIAARDRTVIRRIRSPISIVSSAEHSMALSIDGSVECWGSNKSGQCKLPEALSPCNLVAIGSQWSAARQLDGTSRVWGWGCDGLPWELSHAAIEFLLRHHAKSLDSRFVHALCRQVPGLVVGPSTSTDPPTTEPEFHDRQHGALLLRGGQVICFGWNYFHQCEVPSMPPAAKVSCGTFHTLALSADGSVFDWGYVQGKRTAELAGRIIDIQAVGHSSWALDRDGDLHAWGEIKTVDAIALAVSDPGWLRFAMTNLGKVKLSLFPEHIRKSREFKAIKSMRKLAGD